MFRVRRMQAEDVLGMMAVQLASYQPEYHESLAILQSRYVASPQTAWVALDADGVCGYVVGYDSRLGKLTTLHADFQSDPQPNCLYLHDLAIHPRAKGQRLAEQLIGQVMSSAQAKNYQGLALVAVQGSVVFWQKQGFSVTTLTQSTAQQLASYGSAACYMQYVF
ncbi:MAG: GNAT family N-acetyltransferase [Pseudomonadota bacterium]|nr:GNAT family N-acetyltransferase [Pseudomonadota bacterium]